MVRYLLMFWYVLSCMKIRVNPWRFFQLNADYFNRHKGIYSKYDINRMIPPRWRLGQILDNASYLPSKYPVFLKPEWGQNSYGIYRADSLSELKQLRRQLSGSHLTYLLQEAAPGKREFEVFYIRDANCSQKHSVLSITEVINQKERQFPINGIYNSACSYLDRTPELDRRQIRVLWHYLRRIGHFKIARVGIKADSMEKLLEGRFHIVEINLFAPFPLNLLDTRQSFSRRFRFIRSAMFHLARITTKALKKKDEENIFFKKLIMHYRVKP